MKTTPYYIYTLARTALIVVGALCLAACSTIDDDDRLLYVRPAEVAKHVLIEDFTGQSCINCPAATTLIGDLQEQYGEENIIAVGIYSGYFGKNPTTGALYPLTTETGNYYYDKFGVSTQPSAMIDRHGVNSTTATWATEVYNCIQTAAPLTLAIDNSYDSASRSLTIAITAEGIDNVEGSLQVWLTEDGLVSTQFLADGSRDASYVHNHVFRTSVNDIDGEAITLPQGTAVARTYTLTLDTDWTPENISVVAFVFDNSGVLQVEKAPAVAADNE